MIMKPKVNWILLRATKQQPLTYRRRPSQKSTLDHYTAFTQLQGSLPPLIKSPILADTQLLRIECPGAVEPSSFLGAFDGMLGQLCDLWPPSKLLLIYSLFDGPGQGQTYQQVCLTFQPHLRRTLGLRPESCDAMGLS